MNADEKIQLQCLDILTNRVSSIPNISFKIFTPTIVKFLNSGSIECSHRASDLLVLFFKNARDSAKEDLAKEMSLQGVKEYTATNILKSVAYKSSYRPVSSISESSKAGVHSNAGPVSTKSVLNIDFLTSDPLYAVESITSEQVVSVEVLKRDVADMQPAFEDKETEFNWQQREKHIAKLRAWLRGNGPTHFVDAMVWAFKSMSAAILKAANSLRTTLSSSACQLIKEMAIILGNNIDQFADTYLSNIIKMTALTKKITHTNANMATSAIIANTSYSIRTLNHIHAAMSEKNIQPRLFSGKWLRIVLFRHRNSKSSMDSTGGREIIQNCVSKGLSDASPGVREEMRQAFWAFNEIWPNIANAMLDKLDSSTRKALDRANPNPHKSQPVSSSKPVRAGHSSIKDFIAQSRETGTQPSSNNRRPLEREKVEKPEGAKDLSVKATRLGLSQRAQRRIPPSGPVRATNHTHGANARPISREKHKLAKSESNNSLSSASSADHSTGRQSPSLARSAEETKTAQKPAHETTMSIADQIKSDDSTIVLKGVQSIVEHWKTLGGGLPINLPSPIILSKFFKGIFSLRNKFPEAVQQNILQLLTHPSVVANVLHFVPATEVALASVKTQSDEAAVQSLRTVFSKVGSTQERSSLCAYLISTCLEIETVTAFRDTTIEFCFSVLQSIDPSEFESSAKLKQDIKLIEVAVNNTPANRNGKKFHELFCKVFPPKRVQEATPEKPSHQETSKDVVDTLQVEEMHMSESQKSSPAPAASVDNTAVADADVAMAPVSTEGEDKNLQEVEQATPEATNTVIEPVQEIVAQENVLTEPVVQSTTEESVESEQDGQQQELVVADTAMEEAADPSEKEDAVSEPKSEENALSNTAAENIFVDIKSTGSEGEVASTALYFAENKKENFIEIFHDSRNTPPPSKPQVNKDEKAVNWLKTETEINSYTLKSQNAPLVTVDKLIEQLGAGDISAHGLNKLIAEVDALDTDTRLVWKNNGWFDAVKAALLKFYDLDTVGSSDLKNRALLLLNHLLVSNRDLFLGDEETILQVLLQLNNGPATENRRLARGTVSVRDALLECTPEVGARLLDATFSDFEKSWNDVATTTQHKVFIMSTLTALLKLSLRLESSLGKFNTVIAAGMSSQDSLVRKETYPILVGLLHSPCESAVSEKVLVNLKEGERRLLDYYMTSTEM